ncbi:MAG: uracil-DNA glycosylase [Acidobacteriota bacterium]
MKDADLRHQAAEHLRFAEELGVVGISRDARWRTRATETETASISASGAEKRETVPISAHDLLVEVRNDIGDCTRCKLHKLGRTQIVFGVGNPNADLMFVGEAPGQDEDIQGFPFVGRAGQLLTKIIEAIDLNREDVYIANVLKCRPPNNRNPEPDEVATCQPFLKRQIEAVRPKVIVALGSFAAKTLLQTEESISRLRGRVYKYGDAQLVATYHPAYLLRSPDKKRDTWEDMKKVRALLKSAGE